MIDQTQAIKQVLDRMTTLQQVQQFAMQHQDNAIAMAMATQRANEIKRLQAAAQGQAGQQPQPTVAQQKMAEMSQLPENTGVAALNPEVGMADGGIVAFAGDDTSYVSRNVDTNEYRRYALTKAREMGLNPVFVDGILRHESRTKAHPEGYDPNAKSKTGPVGIGQLTSFIAQRFGLHPNERTDPYKNIDASLGFMDYLNKKYRGDPTKIAVAYNQGESVLDRHLRENRGRVVPENLGAEPRNYIYRTGAARIPTAAVQQPRLTIQADNRPPPPDTRTPLPVPAPIRQALEAIAGGLSGTAQAGEMDDLRRQKLRDAINGVGTGSAPAPAPTKQGIATIPTSAPVPAAPAQPGLDIMELGSITSSPDYKPPAVTRAPADAPQIDTSGMSAEQIPAEALTSSYGEQMGKVFGLVPNMIGSGVNALANFISRDELLSTGQPSAPASGIAAADRVGGGRGSAASYKDYVVGGPKENAFVGFQGRPTMINDARDIRKNPDINDYAGTDKPPIEDLSRPAEPMTPDKPKGLASMTSDDWMNLGFGLLSAKGQNAFQDLGEAGLGMLKGRQERAKTEREIEAAKGLRALQEAQMDQARAYADLARNKPAMAAAALEQRWAAMDETAKAKLRAAYDKDAMAQLNKVPFETWLASKGPGYAGEDAGTITPTPTVGGAAGTGQWGPLQVH